MTINLPSPTISTKDSQTAAVQVALRVRPLTQQDRSQPRFSHSSDSDVIKTFGNTVTIVPHAKSFTFDYVFDTESKQEEVFTGVASNLVDRFVDGYNVTILAYGQTSSGKTYTMGTAMDYQHSTDPDQEGIIPRAMSALFERLNPTTTFSPTSLINNNNNNKKSPTSTFPPSSSGLRLPRKTASSSKLRPASMMPSLSTSNSSSSLHHPLRRGSTPIPQTDLLDKSTKNTVHVSFVEIYNEELIDLLNSAPLNERLPVTIREDAKGHIYWNGVKEVSVDNTEEVLKATGSTDMNAKSSRSHAIFTVTLKQEKWVPSASKSSNPSLRKRDLSPTSTKSSLLARRSSYLNVKAMVGQMERQSTTKDEEQCTADEDGDWVIVQSKFHFVDLAGSERLKRTAAQGDRRKEGININAGLLALGNVISALSDPSYNKKTTHVPYRDSKLTRLLQDSLGGNATTLMIACISPAELNLTETANTIKYAFRARSIKNKAEKNEAEEWMTNDSPEFLRSLIGKLKMEIRSLKTSTTAANTANAIATTNHSSSNRTISPSSSIEHEPLPPSPSPSAVLNSITTASSATNGAVDQVDYDHDQYILVSDLRRQIEELNNELIVTRERNQWVESQLGNQKNHPITSDTSSSANSSSTSLSCADELENNSINNSNKPSTKNSHASNISHDSALGSMDFQHLVEPVIEEYEKSISGLESQLALARAALTHSDEVLTEQEKKIQEYQTLRDQEHASLIDLQEKLAKVMEREQTSELYIQELETKLAVSTEEATRDQDILLALKNKIIHFQEMDATTEHYIAGLESKLAKAEEQQERWNVLAEAAEQRLALQEKHMAILQKKIDAFNQTKQVDDQQDDENEEALARRESIHLQHEHLLQEMEASTTQCNELKETLASIRRHSVNIPDSINVNNLQADKGIDHPSMQALHHQMEQKEAYITVLEKKLVEMDGLHQELSQLRTSHSEKTASLENQLTDMKEKYTTLEKEYEVAQTTIMTINNQLEHHQEENTALLTKQTDLQKQLWEHEKGTQMTLRIRLDEVEKLKLEVLHLQELELKQEQIIHIFEQQLKDMETSMTQLQQLLEAKNAHVQQLEKDNERKDQWLATMKKEMEAILRDMALLGMERKQLDMIISWLDKSLRRYDDKTTASLFSIAELQKIHTLRDADYEAKVKNIAKLETRILELSQSVEKGDTLTQQLKQALADAKSEILNNNDNEQKKRASATIEEQRVMALESQIIELDKAVEETTQKNNSLKAELETTKEELIKAHQQMEKQAAKLTQVEAELKETMAFMEKERELLAANDTTGMLAEMEEKVQILQRARQLDQDEYDSRIDKAMDDLEESKKINKEKSHMITSLEESLQLMQEKLEEAVTSHAKKSSQLQQLQDQLHRRNRADSTNNKLDQEHSTSTSNYDLPPSASPVAGMQSYDVGCLLKQISQQENIIRERDEVITKLQIAAAAAAAASATSSTLSSLPRTSSLNQEQLEREHRLSQQFNNDINENASREELLEQLKQFANDKTQLMIQVDGLESQLVLQRNQFTIETKNMELELMKLSSANDRMEKEMEQILPRYSLPPLSSSVSTGILASSSSSSPSPASSNNNKSAHPNNFTSPPQTPRVSSPPPSIGYKMHRELSSNGNLAKLQKSNSFRAISAMDQHPDDHHSSNILRQSVGQLPRGSFDRPRSFSSTSSYISRTGSIPPPSAPPSNPLPPIPTTPLPAPPPSTTVSTSSTNSSSSSSANSPIGSPRPTSPKPTATITASPQSTILKRHDSVNTTNSLLSDISLPNSQQSTQTTADQYEKLLRSLQRKTQIAESDVRAHQDVISKLEHQLSRSETSVRDAKKQLEVLNREKQAYSLEIQNLRSQVTQIMSQQKTTTDEASERRKQLEQTLEQERKLKEKAEKARSILENRMEELMTKKNKFMCF
ncbi:hypothetical protein BJ944DRAFT_243732 [Cunninghamella echinulata]|nr:hypothetical protein BJ944DRAFT_243732 [Cunninghamella echinulata]